MGTSVHLTYDSTRGTASAVVSDATITITATTKDPYLLYRIHLRCDAGQEKVQDYGGVSGTRTFVSTGHTDCSNTYVTIDFKREDEEKCQIDVMWELDPVEAGSCYPFEKTYYSKPKASCSTSSKIILNSGWEVYRKIRYVNSYIYDDVDYNKTSTFTYSSTFYHNDCDEPWYHSYIITFYARRKQYTLTFDPGSGSVSPSTKLCQYNYPIGTLPTPVHDVPCRCFIGWFTSSSSGGEQITESTYYKWSSNKTVYARYRNPTGKLLYNPDTGNLLYKSSGIVYDGD